MKNPAITVIMPTFNRAEYITEAVESVLCQSVNCFELIVIDDGSTDDTLKKLQCYKDRIRIISTEHKGVSAARNIGIKEARGEWIAFLDSDDIWMPDKLEVQTDYISQNPEIIAHTVNAAYSPDLDDGLSSFETSSFFPEKNEGVVENPLPVQLEHSAFGRVQTILCSRESAIDAGMFDETLSINEDFNFMCKLALQGSWGYSSNELAFIHRRDENTPHLSKTRFEDPINTYSALKKGFEELLEDPLLTESNRKIVNRHLSRALFTLGMENLRAGDKQKAGSMFRYSMKCCFSYKGWIGNALSKTPLSFSRFLASL